jgi:hypothetical protein
MYVFFYVSIIMYFLTAVLAHQPSMLLDTIHNHDTIWGYGACHDEELAGCLSAIRPSF